MVSIFQDMATIIFIFGVSMWEISNILMHLFLYWKYSMSDPSYILLVILSFMYIVMIIWRIFPAFWQCNLYILGTKKEIVLRFC